MTRNLPCKERSKAASREGNWGREGQLLQSQSGLVDTNTKQVKALEITV